MMKRLLQSNRRAGFTLVEMLVAVTLVLLMMSMFASIFQMASESLSTQRGIANNDQKARAFAIRLRSDLDKRTFRSVIPFFQNEDANTSPNSFASRQGYFYLSTNDPSDSSDHVLQFTVNAHVISKNQDETPYYGKGTQLLSDDGLMSVSDRNGDGMVDLRDALLESPNQPEADDANVWTSLISTATRPPRIITQRPPC